MISPDAITSAKPNGDVSDPTSSALRRVRIQTRQAAPTTAERVTDDGAGRAAAREPVFDVHDVAISYGAKRALEDVRLKIYRNVITALIGPSGCGKTTFLRSLNRMNDSVPGFRLEGQILYHGHDLYASGVNNVEVRRKIGMVFQKPNPFPKSIYDNVAWAPRNLGMRGRTGRTRRASAARRRRCGTRSRTGSARARWPVRRPAAAAVHRARDRDRARRAAHRRAGSALDPIATASIEELMHTLKRRYTIVIVTHNMQQAARVADLTAFFNLEPSGGSARAP